MESYYGRMQSSGFWKSDCGFWGLIAWIQVPVPPVNMGKLHHLSVPLSKHEKENNTSLIARCTNQLIHNGAPRTVLINTQ